MSDSQPATHPVSFELLATDIYAAHRDRPFIESEYARALQERCSLCDLYIPDWLMTTPNAYQLNIPAIVAILK